MLLPIFLVGDVHGLVDPLLTALMTAALLLQIQQAERPRVDRAFGLGLLLGAALLTRELGELALLLLPLSLLAFDFGAPAVRTRLARWGGCSLVSLALAALCHAVLYLSPLYYQAGSLHNTAGLTQTSRSLGSVVTDPFKYVSTIWPDVRGALAGYLGIPLLIVVVAVVAMAVRRRSRIPLLLAAWALLPWLAMILFTKFGYPRYVLPAFPPLTASIAGGFVWLWRWLGAHSLNPWLAVALAAATLVPPLILDVGVLAHPGTARYPGEDDFQYAAGWPSGTGMT